MATQEVLRRHFARMGARVAIGDASLLREGEDVRIDIGRDEEGEFFDLRFRRGCAPEVLDVRPDSRHMVLMVRAERAKNKFLLGHDERHWFAAAVPGESVRDVRTAMESLRPEGAEGEGVIRQGEWFFVPVPRFNAAGRPVLRNEPLSRGAGSKPHVCEELIRTGGVSVLVSSRYPIGLTEAEYEKAIAADRELRKLNWQRMVREPEVHARGKVRHADHKTVFLDGWHRVHMNRERFARHAAQVVFLD